MRHVVRRRLGLALATTLTLAAAAAATAAVPGAAGAAPVAGTYYRAVPTCAAPAPGHARCFALRRVTVSRNAAGARKAAALPADVPIGPNGGFTPGDLATAYGANPNAATTQKVGIVDAYDDPNALADLNAFDANYDLPPETSTSFQKVGQTGSAVPPAADTTGWSTEISLDLDAVRGLCHKCKIVLVEANSSSGDDLAAGVNTAVKLGATEVSNSYGGTENSSDDTPAAAAAYNHPGVVITASTGDDGYYDWDYANANPDFNQNAPAPQAGDTVTSSNAPEVPSSLNTVVAVGGTTLQLNDNGTRTGESVWNENGTFDNTGYYATAPQGASGGGCSTEYPAQKWQSSVANYSQTACGKYRLAADVSALADPNTGFDIYDTYAYTTDTTQFQPGWATYGGTSLSSPLIAAMWALAGGSGGVAYPSLSLYGHQKSTAAGLYDVTVGGNGYCDGVSPGECGAYGNPNGTAAGIVDCAWDADGNAAAGTRACEAATGYDGPSGVGTPKGLSAFTALTPHGVITAPRSVTHRRAAGFSGRSSTDPFPGGAITHYHWYWGDGSASSTSAVPAHTWARKGTYTVRLIVSDTYGRVAPTVSRRVTVK
jgi:PKD domain-containing protein